MSAMMTAGRMAAWMGPSLLGGIAVHVFLGAPEAPLLVLAALVAPIVALVRPRERLPATPVSALAVLPGLPLVLGAHLLVIAELGRSSGIPRAVSLIVGLVILLAPAVSAGSRGGAVLALTVAATGGLVAPLVAVATTTPPWTAWSRAASRPAIVFPDGSRAVTEGRAVPAPTTLAFAEPHRVTAVGATTVRLVENDRQPLRVHERRLARGESLMLRPGDRLRLDAGAQVRFEPGKRVPVLLPSGVVWGDPRERGTMPSALAMIGMVVTLVGGAIAVVGSAGAPGGAGGRARAARATARAAIILGRLLRAAVVPALIPIVVLAAAAWGVYAMDRAPDLLVGAAFLSPFTELIATSGNPDAGALRVTVTAALLALLAASSLALFARVAEAVIPLARRAPDAPALVWIGLTAAAGVASVWLNDPWRCLLLGLGLLATTWAAPWLAAGASREAVAGGAVGMLVFGLVAWSPPAADPWVVVAAAPAVVAAPAAWLTARLVRRGSPRGRPVAGPPRG